MNSRILHFIFSLKQSSESIFTGNEFCQWLIVQNYIENELMARAYIDKLRNEQQIICLNQNIHNDSDFLTNWYAFSK